MKLITLNTWGGRQHKELLNFVKINKQKTDFFCLQEVFKSDRSVLTPRDGQSNFLGDLIKELDDFDFLYSPFYHGQEDQFVVDYPLSWGNAIFWKKEIKPKYKGEIFTHLSENVLKEFPDYPQPDVPKNFQYLIFSNLLVMNFHGYWNPAPKTDTPERVKQAEKILKFVKDKNLPTVIGGDFNLRIETKSLLMFEENGFRNLVKESGTKTTRTNLYDIKWRKIDKFADYILTTKNINVYDFKVMKDVVSDHSPLLVDFEG